MRYQIYGGINGILVAFAALLDGRLRFAGKHHQGSVGTLIDTKIVALFRMIGWRSSFAPRSPELVEIALLIGIGSGKRVVFFGRSCDGSQGTRVGWQEKGTAASAA